MALGFMFRLEQRHGMPTRQHPARHTGYPNRCLEGDPLCVESTLLFDFGFANFAGFPNIRDVGLVILPEDQAVELPEYGQLAGAGFLARDTATDREARAGCS